MQLIPTPCPGRSALHVGNGECSDCERYDHNAPLSAIPRTVYAGSIGVWVCEGRRFHAPSLGDVRQSVAYQRRGPEAAFVSSAGDAL